MSILVLNTNILAVDPVDTGDVWQTTDQIIPKHVADGAVLVDVTLPDDYAPGRYTYDGGFVRVPDPVPVVPVPTSVSPRQIRQALTRANLRSQVEDAVTAGDQDLKDWWEFATSCERNHPMVVEMAQGLGVTDEQLDDLFNLAATL